MKDIRILKRLINDYDYCVRYVWDDIEKNQIKEKIKHMLGYIDHSILNKNDEKFIVNLEKKFNV